MNNVANDIHESVVCCDTITEKYKEGCDDNCMNGQVLVGALKGIGFIQYSADSIILTNTSYGGAFESDYGIVFEFDYGSFSYTDELSQFLNAYGGIGKIRMYSDSTCENFDFNEILGGSYTENVIIIQKDGIPAVLVRDQTDGSSLRDHRIQNRMPIPYIIGWALKKMAYGLASGLANGAIEVGMELAIEWSTNDLTWEQTWDVLELDWVEIGVNCGEEAIVAAFLEKVKH